MDNKEEFAKKLKELSDVKKLGIYLSRTLSGGKKQIFPILNKLEASFQNVDYLNFAIDNDNFKLPINMREINDFLKSNDDARNPLIAAHLDYEILLDIRTLLRVFSPKDAVRFMGESDIKPLINPIIPNFGKNYNPTKFNEIINNNLFKTLSFEECQRYINNIVKNNFTKKYLFNNSPNEANFFNFLKLALDELPRDNNYSLDEIAYYPQIVFSDNLPPDFKEKYIQSSNINYEGNLFNQNWFLNKVEVVNSDVNQIKKFIVFTFFNKNGEAYKLKVDPTSFPVPSFFTIKFPKAFHDKIIDLIARSDSNNKNSLTQFLKNYLKN